ncbi:MAG: hypothetical protein E4H23_07990 [Chrysiogenales bacterium]|nr:MAG: hypothetical protein E4H23_07990 [Chrysiogenales bacterium]
MKKIYRSRLALALLLILLALPGLAIDKTIAKKPMIFFAPDLTATIKCPGHALAGQDLRKKIAVMVENKGNAASSGFSVDLVLSSDASVPMTLAGYAANYHDNVLLKGGREFVSSLAAGAKLDLVLNGSNRIPADTPAGDYYLAAVVDSGKAVKEKNENNNIALCRIHISRPDAPGLTVSGFAHTGAPAGSPPECRLLVTINNLGAAPIPLGSGARLDVYVNDVLVDSVDIDSSKVEQTAYHDMHNAFDAANPGKSRSVVGTDYIFPASASGMTYRCRAVVDAGDAISEANEANNSFSRDESIPPH